ncbi:MAG: hypothetical protein J07HX64_02233 [halophilic archaeon J07HX64]|jgi:Uncharacterized protein conserved in archaea|nr:MAG: hypothetical protein J07HX64_02233 [halophilic archaeon J07HX64]
MSNDEPGEYYTEERWQNWLNRLRDEELDAEQEESARLLRNLQYDTAIAVAKILTDHQNDTIDEERALTELTDIQEITLEEVEFDDEDAVILLDGVQTSLLCVLYAGKEFVAAGPAEGTIGQYIEAATVAEDEGDIDDALGYCVQAGTMLIDGQHLDLEMAGELDFGPVAQWVNGLESLQNAMSDPEFVEEEG